jgi:hypothetical protein
MLQLAAGGQLTILYRLWFPPTTKLRFAVDRSFETLKLSCDCTHVRLTPSGFSTFRLLSLPSSAAVVLQ